jgi:putative transposase
MWRPDRHLFLKPVVIRDFADRVGHPFALDYREGLTAGVYESLLDLATLTKREIDGLHLIDFQSFIWVVGACDAAAQREAAAYLQAAFEMSERRACRVIETDRTSVRYETTRPDDCIARPAESSGAGTAALRLPAAACAVRRAGHAVNRKRVPRIYREERLTVRRRGGRPGQLTGREPISQSDPTQTLGRSAVLQDQPHRPLRWRTAGLADHHRFGRFRIVRSVPNGAGERCCRRDGETR